MRNERAPSDAEFGFVIDQTAEPGDVLSALATLLLELVHQEKKENHDSPGQNRSSGTLPQNRDER
jgi:hypothetical protein